VVDDAAIDELYGLPLDEFIAARTRLAKERKAAGDREGAAAVQSIRKPTVAAWAVNQLARREPQRLQALFDAVDHLRAAQEKALHGGGGRQLQEAGAARRAAVDRLADAAASILEEAGHGAGRSNVDAVVNSLHAVAADPEAAGLVRAGRLEKELPPPSGFGDVGDMAVVLPLPDRRAARTTARKAERPSGPAKVQSAAEARARRRDAELAEQADAASREAARRREAADKAQSDLRRLRDEMAEAERLAARMNREAERAEKRAAEARERVERSRARQG